MTDITVGELREIAATIAADVGREAGERRSNGFSWTTKSSRTDVVTEIDTWAEEQVVARIEALRPDDGFLGEEGTNRPSSTGITWVIDPIDGTTNLLYDLPGYSVSIAAAIDSNSHAGAVYDPIRHELFSAALGEGATRNGAPIAPTAATDLSTSLVGTGFSYQSDDRGPQARALEVILPAVRDIRRNGGAALDFCAVACGRLDAYFERGLSPWDSAAGSLIASEAGASVWDDGLSVAVAPGIASSFMALLERASA
jgi:myo-inositol-1(or 4)-monophosphatase